MRYFRSCGLVCVIWLFVHSIKNSEDPSKIVFKWLFSIALVTGEIFFVRRLGGSLQEGEPEGNFGQAFVMAISLAAVGIVLSIVWATQIGAIVVQTDHLTF